MSANFMSAWLFDSLVTTTLLMAAILLIRQPVARIFGAGVAYALWIIPAARLLMPGLEGAPVAPADNVQGVQDNVRDMILSGMTHSDALATNASAPATVFPTIDYTALALTMWLGGAVLLFIIQMIRYAAMRDDLLSEASDIAEIDGVRIIASDQVAGPLAFGLFRQFIAVPLNFTTTFSPAERELAIAHEMAHHKSGDLFANLAAFIILCLQWFNPVAWISWSAFRFDQEAACDARVLAGKGAEDRVIYGQALARTAFDGVPTFATALNSPKTIIERLRRLSMKDATAKRRLFGKLGVLTAAAIILPATATIVPAAIAQDAPAAPADPAAPAAPAAPEAPTTVKKVKVIKIDRDGKTVDIMGHDGDGKNVRKIERDGKIFVFRTDKELSEAEVKKMVADAEKSAGEADKWAANADKMRTNADVARANAEVQRVHAMKMASAYIPEIEFREVTENCKEGQPVTTDVEGFDGTNKSRIRLVMCGKGQVRVARVEAIKGLREARNEISGDADMPAKIRKDVVEKLELQIRRLEAQADKVE
nr:M56 family metallopeptidase [uncultured Sphingorhabdus sp.]